MFVQIVYNYNTYYLLQKNVFKLNTFYYRNLLLLCMLLSKNSATKL